MDRGMVIFVGALLTFSSSWLGLVLFPFWQLNGEQPYQKDPTDDPYPQPLQGKALAGKKVYQQNGCMYCHSQQVRSEKFGNWWDENGQMKTGADIKRGWGLRRNVSRDYIYDNPTMLGTMRTGPDLANVGSRYSEPWQHTHTFNPRSLNDWSIMPSFAFLYTKEGSSASASEKALQTRPRVDRRPRLPLAAERPRVGRDPRASAATRSTRGSSPTRPAARSTSTRPRARSGCSTSG